MLLYWYELKKLLSSAAVWVFIALCLLFNGFLVISDYNDGYADFVSGAAGDTGYILDDSFYEVLEQLKDDGEQAEFLDYLKSETRDAEDVFDGYETKGIAESYIAASGAEGPFAQAMRDKYAELQKVVDEKAEADESLSLYFAGATYHRHQQLFKGLAGWLLVEGALIGALLVFLSVGYENNHRTEDLVYSAKKGRGLLRTKMAASLSAGLGIYVILTLLTLLLYFIVNDYGNIWGSNVSSLFNYRIDLIAGTRPFVTWHSFSVAGYLAAALGMSAGLVLCFSMMAFGIGVLTRNHYIGFLVFLVANAAVILLPIQMPQRTLAIISWIQYSSMLTPAWLWLKQGIWFTDGDVGILWPHFETLGLCVSLLALTAFCIVSAAYFRKRDLR